VADEDALQHRLVASAVGAEAVEQSRRAQDQHPVADVAGCEGVLSAAPLPSSIFLDKNRCGTGKSQSKLTAAKMRPPRSRSGSGCRAAAPAASPTSSGWPGHRPWPAGHCRRTCSLPSASNASSITLKYSPSARLPARHAPPRHTSRDACMLRCCDHCATSDAVFGLKFLARSGVTT
jgi:hypothetical protein